jgi:tRNA modification GTPase
MQGEHDSIAAIATAPGRGGIGVIRVSGPSLGPFILSLLGQSLTPRHAFYLPFKSAQGIPIDHGIALFFEGPHSYTGEDVLELQGHGGPAVMRQLLNRCLEVGKPFQVRLASPGEFTLRAFLNDKIDLAQAEAVSDLIDASSEAAARAAVSSLSGEFSRQVDLLCENITHLRLLIEATLDFPEEEIEFLEKYKAKDQLVVIQQRLNAVISQSKQGMILRDGIRVVLAGEPNVGKSSLLNALSGEDLAIVTDIAGTTRDKVVHLVHLDGVPVTIIDTAGLRETNDQIESIGIARTWDEISKADVVLHLMDAISPAKHLDDDIEAKRPRHSIVLSVFNKIDLAHGFVAPTDTIAISVKNNKGLDTLKKKLLALAGWNPSNESPWMARQRHVDALNLAKTHLDIAQNYANQSDAVLDLFAEELRLAHDALGEITGKVSPDDMLGKIFSRFCIGK